MRQFISSSFDIHEMMSQKEDLVKQLLEHLKRLPNEKAPRLNYSLDQVFKCAFYIGLHKTKIQEEEKTQVATYFKGSIDKIDGYLFRKGNTFDCDHAPYTMLLRSGLQFVLDDYKDFKDSEGCDLQSSLDYLVENQSIETLDESLKHWMETGCLYIYV